ncbi:hypothetical protein LX73_0417 [Fodinibius salinus]|uniref:Uncharacterized protein n=1 Tax=Fodinibius salinus TaxID=860790 RepID=A0A5D3YN47_9BACT|nr:hypothetical protein [Fodinibius salinus]TYP95122.1 hypothetical protein LX73_0417 [Fodinibius salinus]
MSKNSSLGSSPIGGSSKKSERSSQKDTESKKSDDEKNTGRSLGSSPVDIKPDNSPKYDFIPDLGVSKSQQSTSKKSSGEKSTSKSSDSSSDSSKKRIVSYNLEVDLITRVKKAAKREEMYYSSLVSKALKQWLVENQ